MELSLDRFQNIYLPPRLRIRLPRRVQGGEAGAAEVTDDPFTEGYRFRRDAAEEAMHRRMVEDRERLARAFQAKQKPAPPAKPQ